MNDILQPMLASLIDAPLLDPQLVYEPKYDGIRAIAEIAPKGEVRLWSRLGNEKTNQFPEIAAALAKWARARKAPLVLDGEIVALDAKGEPTGFQQLQGRIHLGGRELHTPGSAPRGSRRRDPLGSDPRGSRRRGLTPTDRVAFIAFDILRDGKTDFRDRPLVERRAALERVFDRTGSPLLRISRQVRGDGRDLYKEALERGWEGLIAKQADSLYKSGKRSPDWRKIKIVHEQEFVIGGWTEPRHTRAYFGALLLGVYEGTDLIYVGHTGTGFNERELARVMKLLKPLETEKCPFKNKPKTNERPHWVRPELVAQIKFTEWTADGKLRHPVYLGLRDDKKPTEVRREEKTVLGSKVLGSKVLGSRVRGSPREPRIENPRTENSRTENRVERTENRVEQTGNLIDQLRDLEAARKDGALVLPDGDRLNVSNLHKIFWPKQKFTKGDLFRYYVRAAPFVLPAVADRPLVMKRFPNGITAPPFYQHRAPEVPPGVRSAVVSVVEKRPQIIGGNLKTLLYMTQLAAISQDPWFSRVQHPEFADYSAFDLDPSEGVPFERVLDVARWIRDELDTLGAVGVPKTSGSDGLHIYIPLPAGTPYDAGLLYCQIVAAVVAQRHPKVATTERTVAARGKRVYIDCLQNILGKTLATAYSARASDYAGVSTPLTWQEIDDGVDRKAFTIETAPARFEKIGDLWAALRKSKGVDLARVTRYTERAAAGRLKGDKS
jgi:bifunctional non-homologous end joining protein LigD